MKFRHLLLITLTIFIATSRIFAQKTDSVRVDNGKMIQLVFDFDDPDKFSAFELSLYPFSPGSSGGSFSFNYMAEAGYAFTNDLSFTGRASLPYSPVKDTPGPQRDPAAEVSLFEYSIIGHYNVFSFSPDMHLKTNIYRDKKRQDLYGNFYLPYTSKGVVSVNCGVSHLRTPGARQKSVAMDSMLTLTHMDFTNVLAGVYFTWGYNVRVIHAQNEDVKTKPFHQKFRMHAYLNLSYAVAHSAGYYMLNPRNGEFAALDNDSFEGGIRRYGFRIGFQGNYYFSPHFKIVALGELGKNPGIKDPSAYFTKTPTSDFFRGALGVGFDF